MKEPRTGEPAKKEDPHKGLTIEAPALTLDELNKMTDNFGSNSLIGEGSNCRVFYGKLSNGEQVVIKKTDMSCFQDPESEFKEKVREYHYSLN